MNTTSIAESISRSLGNRRVTGSACTFSRSLFARFATEPYALRDIDKRCVHLTNYSLNKDSGKFIENENEDPSQAGGDAHKWGLQALHWTSHGITGAGHAVPEDGPVPPRVPADEQLRRCTLKQLKSLCAERSLRRNGRKADLLGRLRDAAAAIEERQLQELDRQLSQQVLPVEDEAPQRVARSDSVAILHSDVALKELGWPQWEQRRAAGSARVAFRKAKSRST